MFTQAEQGSLIQLARPILQHQAQVFTKAARASLTHLAQSILQRLARLSFLAERGNHSRRDRLTLRHQDRHPRVRLSTLVEQLQAQLFTLLERELLIPQEREPTSRRGLSFSEVLADSMLDEDRLVFPAAWALGIMS